MSTSQTQFSHFRKWFFPNSLQIHLSHLGSHIFSPRFIRVIPAVQLGSPGFPGRFSRRIMIHIVPHWARNTGSMTWQERTSSSTRNLLEIPSGYLTYPWKITMLLIGKPSISIRLGPSIPWRTVSHNQMVLFLVQINFLAAELPVDIAPCNPPVTRNSRCGVRSCFFSGQDFQ